MGNGKKMVFYKVVAEMLGDVRSNNKLESSFYYYISFLITNYENHGVKTSNEKIIKELGMNSRKYFCYKNGSENIPVKYMGSIIEHGGYLYFFISFWSKLIELFANDDERKSLVMSIDGRYLKYFSLAQSRLKEFEKNQK